MDEQAEREQLLREGEYLYVEIGEEYFKLSRFQTYTADRDGKVINKSIPWMQHEAICIALALFCRKRGIQDAINNV